MNEKITIQELAEQFAESKGIQKKEAENFIKEFFKLIEKALEQERYVKIKGLGTFKLIEVDSRESINVNTGERFEIQGHTKVTFTPEPTLKDLVNKPFAHFESVVLNEGAFVDETPIEEPTEEGSDTIHCVRSEEPALEEEEPTIEEETSIPLLSEEEVTSAGMVGIEEPTIEEEEPSIPLLPEEEVPSYKVVGLEEPTIEETLIEEPTEESRDAIHCTRPEEPTIEEEEPSVEEETSIVMDNHMAQIITNIENELETNKRPKSMIGNLKENIAKDFKEDTQGMKYFFGIVAFIILLCIAAIVFLYHPTLLTDLMPKPQEQEETTQEATPEEVIPADTLTVQTDTIVAQPDTIVAPVVTLPQPTPPPVVEKKPQPATTYKASGVYTIIGTQTEHVIKSGETLRIISEKYFGTRELSTYIVEHNKEIIKNPNNVAIGTKIKIPKLEKKQ